MARIRPYVLSIAGFDPSGGAGVLADIKTFELHKTYGFGVTTALTYQNETDYVGTQWVHKNEIVSQLEPLFQLYKIEYVKIGLIENLDILESIVSYLLSQNAKIKIILDPILKATAAKSNFHDGINIDQFKRILESVYVLTPNWVELEQLSDIPVQDAAIELSKLCHIYLKGGHRPDRLGYDTLFLKGGVKSYNFRPKRVVRFDKHGSGCVLSSALTANLASGYPILKSCLRSKRYIEDFLNSNPTGLGWHKR